MHGLIKCYTLLLQEELMQMLFEGAELARIQLILSTSNVFIMPRLDQSGSFLGPALTVLSANVEGFSTAEQ